MKTLLFTLISILAFAIWAFGSSVFKSEWQLYSACAVVFLIGGGLSLLPGSGYQSKQEAGKFVGRFALGFLAYSVIWSIAWFTFRNTFGEVSGSFFGLIALAAILGKGKPFPSGIMSGVAILFLWHTIGYYIGGYLYEILQNRGQFGIELKASRQTITHIARLSWGLGYGAGLGYGLSRWLQLSRQA